jgi:hypothetical protein
MSGLDVLGAVASAIQLGMLCVSATNRLCAILSDHKLSQAIHTECISLATEIDDRILNLNSENRIPAEQLRQRLNTIQTRIERRKKRTWTIKWINHMRLSGVSDKEDILFALQTYQTRASLSGTATMEEIQQRLGADGIPQEVLTPIIQNLVSPVIVSCNGRMS